MLFSVLFCGKVKKTEKRGRELSVFWVFLNLVTWNTMMFVRLAGVSGEAARAGGCYLWPRHSFQAQCGLKGQGSMSWCSWHPTGTPKSSGLSNWSQVTGAVSGRAATPYQPYSPPPFTWPLGDRSWNIKQGLMVHNIWKNQHHGI